MATIKIVYEDLTQEQFDSFMEFWRGGYGNAKGFRFKIDPSETFVSSGWKSPKSRREIADDIAKALKKEDN